MGPPKDNRKMFYGADHITFDKATELRKNMKNRDLFKSKFRRQHPINIFIVDFYCHEFKLAIELDGGIHKSKKALKNDSDRQHFLEKLGIKILRFSNDQIILNINNVLAEIQLGIRN